MIQGVSWTIQNQVFQVQYLSTTYGANTPYLLATFNQVPAGYVAQGTFSIAPSALVNAPQTNQLMGAATFVLLRNGNPEHTWSGFDELVNFTAQPLDNISIACYGGPFYSTQGTFYASANGANGLISANWTQAIIPASAAVPVAPYIAQGTSPNVNPQTGTFLATATYAGSTDNTMPLLTANGDTTILAYPFANVLGIEASITVWSSSGIAWAQAIVEDAAPYNTLQPSPRILVNLVCAGGTASPGSQAIYMPLTGYTQQGGLQLLTAVHGSVSSVVVAVTAQLQACSYLPTTDVT